MIDLTITDEELNSLRKYKEQKYEAINQVLVSNCEKDIALLNADSENNAVVIPYDIESVKEYMNIIKSIYSLILKKYYSSSNKKVNLYRGTNLAEIDTITNELFIDRFLSATENEEEALNLYSIVWSKPACINIELTDRVPYIRLNEILEDEKYKNEILISPFTKALSIVDTGIKVVGNNSRCVKNFNIKLEKQDLEELSELDRRGLYNYILDNSYSIKRRLKECVELEKENSINFENIRKLEQLLGKYETAIDEKVQNDNYSEMDREADYDDIARIAKELEILKNTTAHIYEVINENIDFINLWKRNIAVYMMAECREIENRFEEAKIELEKAREEEQENIEEKACEEQQADNQIEEVIEDNSKETLELEESENATENIEDSKEPVNENIEEDVEENVQEDEQVAENIDDTKIVEIIEEQESDEAEDTLAFRVKAECKENIESAEKLLSDIKDLITKQQNHAKIAGNMGASYSALNNAFEMRKVAETLLELLKNIKLKVLAIIEQENEEEAKEKLEKISKINIDISTLMNYLNNPKIATRNTKATRFDEMAIIEENQLKKGISERIRNIRGEAELKKLKDDLEILEDKGKLSRFFGIFTGRNKLDEFMMDQIEIRRQAIRKTLSKKLSLAYNYSIHELMAEITMFINENEDDELVEDDVTDFKALSEELRRNFVILDSKVKSIIEEKEGKNLPVENRKLSKRDIIEIETYRFLNKYGYDIQINEKEEPKYQDTMANEIARIIEYINSSNVL